MSHFFKLFQNSTWEKDQKVLPQVDLPSASKQSIQTRKIINITVEFLSFYIYIIFRLLMHKVEKILKRSLDSISSPSLSVEIQIMGL